MYKFIFALILATTLLSATAQGVEQKPATYLLQVSSNLSCEILDIELLSDSGAVAKTLQFTDNAFAATELVTGTYTFGEITCASGNVQIAKFDLSLRDLAPVHVKSDQVYFGGKLIVKQSEDVILQTPGILENCTSGGSYGDECMDGVGVKTILRQNKTIDLYAPILANGEVNEVRTALKISESQLVYIPLIPQAG